MLNVAKYTKRDLKFQFTKKHLSNEKMSPGFLFRHGGGEEAKKTPPRYLNWGAARNIANGKNRVGAWCGNFLLVPTLSLLPLLRSCFALRP